MPCAGVMEPSHVLQLQKLRRRIGGCASDRIVVRSKKERRQDVSPGRLFRLGISALLGRDDPQK